MRRTTALLTVIVLILTMLAACSKPLSNLSAAELLDHGEKYLLEMDYEQALVQFLKVIEVEPMNPRGYTGAAEAYIVLGDNDNAIEILQIGLGLLSSNMKIQEMLLELQSTDTIEPTDISLNEGNAIEQENLEIPLEIRSLFTELVSVFKSQDRYEVRRLMENSALVEYIQQSDVDIKCDDLIVYRGCWSAMYMGAITDGTGIFIRWSKFKNDKGFGYSWYVADVRDSQFNGNYNTYTDYDYLENDIVAISTHGYLVNGLYDGERVFTWHKADGNISEMTQNYISGFLNGNSNGQEIGFPLTNGEPADNLINLIDMPNY